MKRRLILNILFFLGSLLFLYLPLHLLGSHLSKADLIGTAERIHQNFSTTKSILVTITFIILPVILYHAIKYSKQLLKKHLNRRIKLFTLIVVTCVFFLMTEIKLLKHVVDDLYIHLNNNFIVNIEQLKKKDELFFTRSKYVVDNFLIVPAGGTSTWFGIYPDSVVMDSTLRAEDTLASKHFWFSEGEGEISLNQIPDGRYLILYGSCYWGSELFITINTK